MMKRKKSIRSCSDCLMIMLIVLLMMLVSVSSVSALGILPARTSLYQEGTKQLSGDFTIVPSTADPVLIDLSVEGELEDHVTLSFDKKEVQGSVKLEFSLDPPLNLKPGNHVAKILVKELPIGAGTVSAMPAVYHTINMFTPYPDRYLETDFLIIDNNIHMLKFTTIMLNRGTLDIEGIDAEINIYYGDEKVATLYKAVAGIQDYDIVYGYTVPGNVDDRVLSLSRKLFSVPMGQSREMQLSMKKFEFKTGEYIIESVVRYDKEELVTEKSIKIGQEEIYIYPETEIAYFNEISKIDLSVGSNWNKELENVALSASVWQDDEMIADLDSDQNKDNVDIKPFKNASAYVYWDATGLGLGEYTIKVKAQYENLTFDDSFDVSLEIKPVEEGDVLNYALLLIVVLLLVLISILLWKGETVRWFISRLFRRR